MKLIGLTQRVEVLAQRNERRDCLDQAWTNLLLDHGFWPVPLPNQISDAESLLTRLNLAGVILTGGNDIGTIPERDALEHALISACAHRKIPLLGVCRGIELLNVHYGGAIAPVTGHVAVTHDLRPGQTGRMPLRSTVNSFHDFGIPETSLSPELIPTAYASDGTVEAAVHRTLPQWGIMWHPERGERVESDGILLRTLFV